MIPEKKDVFMAAGKMAKVMKTYNSQVEYSPEVYERMMEARKEFNTKLTILKEKERMMNNGSSEN